MLSSDCGYVSFFSTNLSKSAHQLIQEKISELSLNDSILDLTGCGFGNITSKHLSLVTCSLTSIPTHIHEICCANNNLRLLKDEKEIYLKHLFSSIPSHITSINLSNNDLYGFGIESLTKILNYLPAHIKIIDLSNNQLHLHPVDQFILLLKNIDGRKTIILENKKLVSNLQQKFNSAFNCFLFCSKVKPAITASLPKELLKEIRDYIPICKLK